MKRLFIIASLVAFFALAFPGISHVQGTAQAVTEDEARVASTKAIALIQKAQSGWFDKQTCSSCHHQLLPEITLKVARERGVELNESTARTMTTETFAPLKDLDTVVQGNFYIDVFFDSWILTSASRVGIKANPATAAYAQFIASRQEGDGSWPTIDSRPPQAHSVFAATAVAAEAIRQYLPAQFKTELTTRLLKARTWLLRSQPATTEDRAYHLLGLLWTGGEASARHKAAEKLLAEQRPDGGWAQLPSRASDSYATGEVLFALHQAGGVRVSDPAYQRGLRFLLSTQQPDGAWLVASRMNPPAPISPPYVDTGFPAGHDQFVSIMGTGWAVNALLQTLPVTAKPTAPMELAAGDQPEWVQVALSGTAAELKNLLDANTSPNSKTKGGTTALMLAARDPEKVKLLIARGAEVNARAESGSTALMIAARYRGNVDTVRLLLQHGAKPNVEGEVLNSASAFFFAVMAGDVQTAQVLASAGAKTDQQMKILGQFMNTPIVATLGFHDPSMTAFLLKNGANPDVEDEFKITPLSWATISNRVDTVRVLLKAGAQVNHADKFGMTPLLYAASIDFGDTRVLEALVAAGADVNARNKEGKTALDLAKGYKFAKTATLLSGKIAAR